MPDADLKKIRTEELEMGLDRGWRTGPARHRVELELFERYAAPARRIEQRMLAGTIVAAVVCVSGLIAALLT